MTVRKVIRMELPVEMEEWKLHRSQERERQLALLRMPHEELVAKLWQRYMIPDALIHIALDMSESHWQVIKKSGNAPPRMTITGLRYVLTADLKSWIDAQPKTTELLQRRRLPRKSANPATDNSVPPALHAAPRYTR